MGLRFYRRLSILPGLRLNASRSGVSLSIGHRGAWLTIGPRGRRATIGIPGSGIFWTETAPPIHAGHRCAFCLVVVLLAAAAVFFWLMRT